MDKTSANGHTKRIAINAIYGKRLKDNLKAIRTIFPEHPYNNEVTPNCLSNRIKLWEHEGN